MRDGFIKVSAVTPEVRPADVDFNVSKIIEAMEAEKEKHSKICVFPELSITGCTCGDLFSQKALLRAAEKGLVQIADASKGSDMLTFVGLPWTENGMLYNAVAAVQNGEILEIITDDNCDVLFQCEEIEDLSIAVELGDDFLSPYSMDRDHAAAGATVIVHPSAKEMTVGGDAYTDSMIMSRSALLSCAYIHANAGCGESSTDLVFAGHNVIAESGHIVAASPAFSNAAVTTEIDVERLALDRMNSEHYTASEDAYQIVDFSLDEEQTEITRKIDGMVFIPKGDEAGENLDTILNIQAQGLKTRMQRIGCKNVCLGISGGLDSTCALIVCVKAFDDLNISRNNIHAVTMPCFGTSDRTYRNACSMIKIFGCRFDEIRIGDAVMQHFKDIGHDPENRNVAYENAQARERTQILMDIANDENGLVVGTGDLSELALGWATYNGDHMSNYAVNSSVPKTLMRHLVARYAETCGNQALHDILTDVIDTPVSPELLPPKDGVISQKTEDLVGPYELHDFFLYYVLRFGFMPSKIFRLACIAWEGTYDQETILKWLKNFYRRFITQQFKRSCMPDGPKVGTVGLSPRGGFAMPSDASYKVWMDEIDTIQLR